MMIKTWSVLLLTLLLAVGGCAGPVEPQPVTPTLSSRVATPTAVTPTWTPTLTPTATPMPTPTPVVWLPPRSDSGWECDPSGGPACYASLSDIAMVSADEGWAVGEEGSIFHYRDGRWQEVDSPTAQQLCCCLDGNAKVR